MPDDPTVSADCRAVAKFDGNTVENFRVVRNAMEIWHYKVPIGGEFRRFFGPNTEALRGIVDVKV